MHATRLLAPLSLVMIALAVALTILGTPDAPTSRAQQVADTPTLATAGYPAPATATEAAYPAPNTTATAVTATPAPRTPPAVPSVTEVTPVTPVATAAATPLATPTAASTPFVAPTRPLATPPQPAAAPSAAPSDVVAATPTPTETSELNCPPGERIAISADGPPTAGYLILFGGRTVGGGTVPPDGLLRAELIIGNERPGRYPISIVQRGSGQELRRLNCTVPLRQSQPTARP